MFLELFSITLFIPLISFILETKISENSFYLFFKNNFDLDLAFILNDLKTFILFFIAIFLIKSFLTIFCHYHKIGFTYKIRKYLTTNIYQKYLNLSYENFIKENSSKYLKNINFEIKIVSEGLLQSLEFFSEIIVIVGLAIFLLNYNLEASIIILSISLLFIYLISIITKKKIFQLGDRIRNFEQFRLKNYLESFNLIKEIKIFNKEKFFKNRDLKLTSESLQNDFLFRFIKSVPRILIELLLIVIFLFIIIVNIGQYDTKYMLELLAIFGASAFRLMPSVNRIITSLQQLRYALPSTNNIINELSTQTNGLFSSVKGKKIIKFNNNILFSNVHFKYKKSKKYIFKNLNLNISSGKIVGIKGKTGSGKTTIVNLISGLIDPTDGLLMIDQVDYKDLDIKSLYKLIGYVPQDVYLMDTTIKENITFGSEDLKKNDIEEAVRKANLDKFVEELPEGLNTIIGEKSSKISGGQAQRIGIARAIVKKPSILIFDEATNSLDSNTEDQIMNSIKKLKSELSIIIISHNSNCLKICDEIIDLDEKSAK
jgi:ABC-type multidrug transport system fused ATPase/permease subunit